MIFCLVSSPRYTQKYSSYSFIQCTTVSLINQPMQVDTWLPRTTDLHMAQLQKQVWTQGNLNIGHKSPFCTEKWGLRDSLDFALRIFVLLSLVLFCLVWFWEPKSGNTHIKPFKVKDKKQSFSIKNKQSRHIYTCPVACHITAGKRSEKTE